jgi:hypothetical protein
MMTLEFDDELNFAEVDIEIRPPDRNARYLREYPDRWHVSTEPFSEVPLKIILDGIGTA